MPSPPAPSVANDWPQRSKSWPQVLTRPRANTSSSGLGPELPDAAAAQPPHAVRRLDVAVDVDRLVEVEHPVRPPAEGVDDVVRVLGAEAREHDLRVVRLAVAVGVAQ